MVLEGWAVVWARLRRVFETVADDLSEETPKFRWAVVEDGQIQMMHGYLTVMTDDRNPATDDENLMVDFEVGLADGFAPDRGNRLRPKYGDLCTATLDLSIDNGHVISEFEPRSFVLDEEGEWVYRLLAYVDDAEVYLRENMDLMTTVLNGKSP